MNYEYCVTFLNRRGKQETIEAPDEKRAVAAGKAWAKNETFKLYRNGELLGMYQHGKSIKLTL